MSGPHAHAPPPPPPPPPPHGSTENNGNTKSSGLPPGNYDIFVIPPHSSGSGFLYLPSLQTHRNSFLAGVACTLGAVGLWLMIAPAVRHIYQNFVTSSGVAMAMILCGFSFAAYWIGNRQTESARGPSAANPPPPPPPPQPDPGPNASHGSWSQRPAGGVPPSGVPPNGGGFNPSAGSTPFGASTAGAKPSWQRTNNTSSASGWEKAREDMRKAQEEKKRKEEAEKKAKEAADKERWEKAQARAKELREKLAREKEAKEKEAKEKMEKEAQEKEKQERAAAAAEQRSKAAASARSVHKQNYQKPTAASYLGDESEFSFRPYDEPKRSANKHGSQSSFFSAASSHVSQSTARTTPPPSNRGPYMNKDPDKITIRAVYCFSDHFAKPVAELISGSGNVTDGLILRMTTEGLFIDDDVRGVPQREWDVRAWTMKLVESGDFRGKHIVRASIRDAENKKYVFILDDSEAWKVAVGLQRLRRGSQVRSLNTSGLSLNEMRNIFTNTGWL